MWNPFKKNQYSNQDLNFLIDLLIHEVNHLIDDISELKADLEDLTDFVEENLD